MSAVVNLQKGQTVSLTKKAPGLNKVIVGLGWDPVDKNEGKGLLGLLFGSSGNAQDIDCDAFALALENNRLRNSNRVCYFGDRNILGGTIYHTGDNLTGEGEGDDEQIIMKLADIPSSIDRIVVAVNIYKGRSRHQSFGQIKNAFIRIVDASNNIELCRYDLSNSPEYANVVTVHFGDLIREENGWKFEAIGHADNAGSISDFANQF